MSLLNLIVPKFPSVPNLPGVPSLLRSPLVAEATTILSPLIGSFLGSFSQTWGIFDSRGNQAITPDTFLGIEYNYPTQVSNYPVEQGTFASYNKVDIPFTADVKMAVGGTLSDREHFYTALQNMVDSIDFYTVVTPEVRYSHMNLERYDYRRETKNGAGMLIVNCHFVQIRRAKTVYSGKTTVPESHLTNPTTSTGLIDPSKVTSPTAAAVSNLGMTASKVCSPSLISGVKSGLGGW